MMLFVLLIILYCLFLYLRVWAVVVVCTLVYSVYMFTNNTLQYLESTTRTTLETSNEAISEVVFPSLTVCNMVQVVASLTLEVR